MPWARAHATATRAAAKLPGAALCLVCAPAKLGTVELLVDDPHAAITTAARADTGSGTTERLISAPLIWDEAKLRASARRVVGIATDSAAPTV
jgi:hypothetical protein